MVQSEIISTTSRLMEQIKSSTSPYNKITHMIEYLNYVFNNVNELTEFESIVELGRIMELAMKKVAEIRTDANCTNIVACKMPRTSLNPT